MIFRRLYLAVRSLPKSLLFNLRYFPVRDAIRFPVLVSHRVWLRELRGKVVLDVPRNELRTGMVKIGFGEVGIFDPRHSRTIWQVSGEVVFRGKTHIGHGSRLSVLGTLVLGRDFTATAETAIVCRKRIVVGDGCLVSWDVLIIDTDFHRLYDEEGRQLNADAPIEIGNQVWIGCRALILKGTSIDDGSVIAAGSIVNRPIPGERSLVAGSPAQVVRESIRWEP